MEFSWVISKFGWFDVKSSLDIGNVYSFTEWKHGKVAENCRILSWSQNPSDGKQCLWFHQHYKSTKKPWNGTLHIFDFSCYHHNPEPNIIVKYNINGHRHIQFHFVCIYDSPTISSVSGSISMS